MTADTFPYSFKVNASKVVDKDEKISVAPDAASRAAIASTFDLNAIHALTADFTLKPYRKAGLRVVGPIKATISQTCVVSLEPFDSELELEVDRTFEPHSTRPRKIRDLNDEGEIEIDLESLDPPDVILDGVLDLGAVICEELALSLDPFPRREGVAFEGGDADDDEVVEEEPEKPSPFAALQALKDKPEGGT
ncbi:YceD family protein [Roseibium sp.]|uniref:YceD family protein n=1 Tax=Roseibium sp. TaxID=1936156 RepID=UPI003BAE6C40